MGFTTPGPQITDMFMRSGKGVITVYDITKEAGAMQINKIFVEDGAGFGWDGSIDEEKGKIKVFDHVTGNSYKYPIFKKA
ncbi:MAG: hypothetical protein Tsb0015_10830 [Simkaniaceae bacterium]